MFQAENVIYFLNHIADGDVGSTMRGYTGAVMFLPVLLMLLIIPIMKKFRGMLKKSIPYMMCIFIVSIILPFSLVINSLIYINQVCDLALWAMIYFFFALLFANIISVYYTRFSYVNDDEYKNNIFIDGYKIEKVINIPKFKRINALFVLVHVITPLSTLVALLCLIASESNIYLYISIGLMLMGAYSYMLYFIWFRWYFKCHHCKNPIYSTRVEDGRRLYFYIMLRVFRYHRFTCMYCHAHYQLGDRDIITEKGLVIKSKHEADFIVEKKR